MTDKSKFTKGCCTPTARRALETPLNPVPAVQRGDDSAGTWVELPGGEFLMGTDFVDAFSADGEGPVRPVSLRPFAIDRFAVTNQRFAKFVDQTGYVTEAERFGWSFVFWSHIPKARFADLVVDTVAAAPWWCQVPGACWRAPEGSGSTFGKREDHPVVHVTWNDAQAFCQWEGTRLPTEAEWEYAARGGLVQKLYPWGDQLRPGGEHRCNIWQGTFPEADTAEDGFAGTCPVDSYEPNAFGLYAMTGNAWEWCQDWFGTAHETLQPTVNPTGPETGSARVMKGGSFLCHKSYCNRYRVAARSSNTPDSSTSNLGFRTAR